jgi:arginine decarboxylase
VAEQNMELELPDASVAAELNQLLKNTVAPQDRTKVGAKHHQHQPEAPKAPWTIEDSENQYRIQGWGEPYFSINAAGHVTVAPQGDRGGSLDLYELVSSLQQRNLALPLLIRFSDILEHRIERLNGCFAKAIARYNYGGIYKGVFPVKCNQQKHLIEDLVKFGKPYQFGLEAGSKPELMIAIAMLNNPGALLICNGYKDREYIETAMLAQKLDQTPIIVLEQIEEVEIAIAAAKALGIKPNLGVRAKLNAKGIGRWGVSSGDRAKFGLTIPEIIMVVDRLKEVDMLDSLKLLHFHIGSQISSISVIKDAIGEASKIYVELVQLGANMQYLDVGGGLGIDYDGSQTNFHASKNYDLQNYANDIVAEVKDTCNEKNIPVPTLISESGRAIASHQSVLIFDVLSTCEVRTDLPQPTTQPEHQIVRNMWETYESISPENYREAFYDANQFKEEALSRFKLGYLSLTERSRAEQLYWACCQKILDIAKREEYLPEDLEELEQIMASIYYINLSVFQSAPDSWAIDQLFPIMPIHRLDEEPVRRGILADLTCDSDGKIDQFIDLKDVKHVLELHPLEPDKPYYLGLFLGGAYQEIMGNLHNLFGDTNAVHIKLTPKGYKIEHVVKGDTMTEVVGYVQYDVEDLIESIRQKAEQALLENRIQISEAQRLLQNYEHSLSQYTYLAP